MAKKKVLLIQPPVEDYYSTPARTYPLGLLYVAAAPKKAGHEVVLLDAMAGGKKKVIPVPEKFSYLKEYYKPGDKSPYRLFGHYYHFGLSWEEVADRIKAESPDIIGISSLFTPYHSMALKTAAIAKTVLPSVPVVMGGHHVSVCPENSRDVDHLIRGEGEGPFMELLGDSPPAAPHFPARELLAPGAYTCQRKTMDFLLTSRGCPHACAFCSVHSVFGKYEPRPVDEILEEMDACINQRGTGHFDIEDDSFGFDREHTLRFLTGVIRKKCPELTLSLMNGLCADVLDKEMLSLMRQAGFSTLNLSVISANAATCGRMRRPFDAEDFRARVLLAAEQGFSIIAYCILGLPGETPDDMMATLQFLHALPVTIGPSLFYPVPGTPLFRECAEKGYLRENDPDLFRLTAACVETPDFKRADIMTFFYISRMLNLLKELKARKPGPAAQQAAREVFDTRKFFHYFKNGKSEAVCSGRVLEMFFGNSWIQPV